MSRTPKSERQHDKATAASDRWTKRSYAERDPNPRHPTHVRQAQAIDREQTKLRGTDRAHERHTNRELRANGYDPTRMSPAQRAVAPLDHRWQSRGREAGR